ncbi:hypothetical protein H1C71_006956, partial [Ictidomys tridecemlineatus]
MGALGGASCAQLRGQCPLCRPWARLKAALKPSGVRLSPSLCLSSQRLSPVSHQVTHVSLLYSPHPVTCSSSRSLWSPLPPSGSRLPATPAGPSPQAVRTEGAGLRRASGRGDSLEGSVLLAEASSGPQPLQKDINICSSFRRLSGVFPQRKGKTQSRPGWGQGSQRVKEG